jgi:hypothetical protein
VAEAEMGEEMKTNGPKEKGERDIHSRTLETGGINDVWVAKHMDIINRRKEIAYTDKGERG